MMIYVPLNNIIMTLAHCSNSYVCGTCWQEYTGIVCDINGVSLIMPAVGKMKGNEGTVTFFCTGVYKEYFYHWLACHKTLLLPDDQWCPQCGNNK
jgi:DNA-directed RNA polymerase subunit RPC12/RpoP